MPKINRPSWATHIVSAMTPTSSHPDRATRKNYWYVDTGVEIKLQRSDDITNSHYPPVVVTVDSKGSLNWWRKNIRVERELEPLAFIAQLDADNDAIDDLKTLDELLELDAEEVLQWLTDHRDNVALVPRSLNKRLREAYNESIEAFHDGEEADGCPDDQWHAMLEEWEHGKAQS
tara:strand:- start:3959 stop:4483 length:525 start_codon:yes stop_codon:yes gene_type:complete